MLLQLFTNSTAALLEALALRYLVARTETGLDVLQFPVETLAMS